MRRRKNNTTLEEFDKTQLVDKELIDKISLWMLRIIVNLGASKEFIDKDNSIRRDSIAYFLDIGKYLEMDSEDFKRSEPLALLKRNYIKLEKRKRFSSSKILSKNIKQISNLMNLNQYEEQILEFTVLINQYDILDETADLLGSSLNSSQAKKMLSGILNIPMVHINAAFKSNSKLSKSSIVSINKSFHHDMRNKIEILSDEFADNMFNLDEDISVMIKNAVRPCDKNSLKLKDYKHISKDMDIVIPYLKHAIENKKQGVNILFYGLPGTGKTELAKTISQSIKTKLFEISYADGEEEAIDGYNRLKAYKTAQSLLANQNILLMYDEAEDIFDSSDSPLMPKRQDNKAWLNRLLETNTIPTIWITNNIYSIDNAMVRRFDFSVEIPIPNKSKRAEIIKNYSNNLLDEHSIKVLAENENIAPALITRATKVISSIDTDDKPKAFTQVLNNTLKAQGYKEIKEKIVTLLPNVYDPKFINTTTDLEQLTQGIKEHQNARLCLYGAAGTGKSAFGRYIAETLNKPLLLKKGSDLISMWVGGTEKNIADAFEEAREEKAVLVFDEVDSFLADRTQAKQSWEVTQVNEMLVQMENFEGIFIATTNLMDNLDKASLRRFDLKLEFDFLKSEQSWNMFLSYCKDLKLTKPSISFKRGVESLRYLTPGDFAAVTRQNRFRPISNVKDFIQRLEDEIAVKNVSSGNVIGFLVP
ncbi:AAA family ATPase [Sulfurimonas sp. SAG-AH-194-C21]|nr:AAA family ATPase [Sulfurimonas sp. SAG-AH-194-C21]MDF1883692.1 AAA family ATPase [Sulfurimonas sp. SAG-AH-194-C21]